MPIGSFKVVGVDTFEAFDTGYLIGDFWTFEQATDSFSFFHARN
jgi:hypothetical protein